MYLEILWPHLAADSHLVLPGNSFSQMGKFAKAVNYLKSASFHHSALFGSELCREPDALSLLITLHPRFPRMAAFCVMMPRKTLLEYITLNGII